MRRILFQWRGITVWSYPAMLYLGLVAGVLVGNLAAHHGNVPAFPVFIATLILIPFAIVGARLLYVAAHWSEYRQSPERIWNRNEGGMAMFGGLPVMLLLSLPVLRLVGLRFAEFWDVAVLTVMAGMALTKIGCLLNGCCAGRESQGGLSMHLPGLTGVWAPRVPSQILEAIWAVVVLICGELLLGRLPFRGAVFLIVAALYSAGRLCLEAFRERPAGESRMSIGNTVSALTIVATLAVLVAAWPR